MSFFSTKGSSVELPLVLSGHRDMKRHIRKVGTLIFALLSFIYFGSIYWNLSISEFVVQSTDVSIRKALGYLYSEDSSEIVLLGAKYYQGSQGSPDVGTLNTRESIEKQLPGFKFTSNYDDNSIDRNIPFVYEAANAPYLLKFKIQYRLLDIVAEMNDEFDSMLAVAKWVGTRWDHGVNNLPQNGKYDPIPIVESGQTGSKYWCEIAAIVMVQAATSLGWPARLVTASRDGYHWEHALAEVWSNQFQKWFVIDVDYNILYLADGKPLSAYELCHSGLQLQEAGKLRVEQFAPLKKSLSMQDLLPYYRYVHIDLRNDWYSRKLRRGSPAGGDLATWWTARPGLGRLLTAKIREDKPERFDWPVNIAYMVPDEIIRENVSSTYILKMSLAGYSPYFKEFQISLDNGLNWMTIDESSFEMRLEEGEHCIFAHMITSSGWVGPNTELCYQHKM